MFSSVCKRLRCFLSFLLQPALTIVFVETKRGVDDLEQWLSRNGFPATAIHGDKVQWVSIHTNVYVISDFSLSFSGLY